MAINKSLLKELKDKHNLEVFFETGFYHGYSASTAMELGFNKLYSVELLRKFVDYGNEKFKKEIAEGRVNIIFDDSSNLKDHISSLLDKKVLFWLDAHLDNGLDTAVSKPTSECPVVQEISALSRFKTKPIILVDDISIIRGKGHGPKGWGDEQISVDKIIEAINKLPFDYTISYSDNAGISNDILVAE